MGFKDFFKFRSWVPDLTREPPPKREWPDHIISLNRKNFDKFIDKYPLSVVDFWAGWCKPCKTIAPRIRQLSKSYKGKVAFGKVNVDSESELSKRFHILGIPNLILFSYGQKVTSLTGVKQVDVYEKELEKILSKFEN